MGYSSQEKLDIMNLYLTNNKSVTQTQIEHRRLYPNRQTPSKNTIRNIWKQFQERKTLERKTRTVVRDNDADLDILLYFEGNHMTIFYLLPIRVVRIELN